MSRRFFILVAFLFFILYSGAALYGLPQSWVGDELVFLAAGFSLLAEKTLQANFTFFYLPPLLAYLAAPVYAAVGMFGVLGGWFGSLSEYRDFVLVYREYFLVVNRLISAIFGVLGLGLIYVWARELWGRRAAWLALVFLGFDFLYLHEAQVGRFWLPATVLTLAGLYALWRFSEGHGQRWIIAAALFIGLGFGVGYVSLLLLGWWAIFAYQRSRWRPNRHLWFSALVLASLIALFAWANPVAFKWQFGRTLLSVFELVGYDPGWVLRATPPSGSFANNIYSGLAFLWRNNPWLLLGGLLGWAAIWWKEKWSTRLLVVLFPLVFFFAFNFANGESFARFYLPVIPGLVLGLVYLIERGLVSRVRQAWLRSLGGLLIVVIVSLLVFRAGLYFILLQRPDTRELALGWTQEQITTGSLVIWDVDSTHLNSNRAALEYKLKENPDALNTRERYLLSLPDDILPAPNYFVVDPVKVPVPNLNQTNLPGHYYVLSYWTEDERQRKLARWPGGKLVKKIRPTQGAQVIDFVNEPPAGILDLLALRHLGPFIEIYDLTND